MTTIKMKFERYVYNGELKDVPFFKGKVYDCIVPKREFVEIFYLSENSYNIYTMNHQTFFENFEREITYNAKVILKALE